MKTYYKLALSILLTFSLSSCLVDPDLILNLGKKPPESTSSDSSLLIGGKTLRQQINLKLDKLELEEFQEVDFTNYIDLKSSILKPEQLSWSSKNNDIALIDSNTGKLRALKEGTTIILVSLKNNQDIFAVIDLKITKKKLVSNIQVIPPNFNLLIGQSKDLRAEVYLSDGQINGNVSWTSSDNTIATISQTGKVTALKKGKVTIVATYNIDSSYKAVSVLEVTDTITDIPNIGNTSSNTNITNPIPTNNDPITSLFNFSYDNDKQGYTLKEYKGIAQSIAIPENFNNSKVISIAPKAFYNKELVNILIPNSVISIGYDSFYNNKLTNVVIPNSVTSIGNNVFRNNNLISVTIPNTISSIGFAAFKDNKLPNITIPNSVKAIDDYAFSNNKLTTLIIPESVNSVGFFAFADNQLKEVTFLGKNTEINQEDYVFGKPIQSTLITIKGYKGSTAESFAINNRINFIPLD